MAKDQDPGKQPPEGTPAGEAGKDAGKEKLIFGKYKTKEEAEKAFKEGETKYHEGQTKLAETEKLLEIERQRTRLVEEKQEEIKKATTEEEKKKLEQDLEQMGKEFAEESKKGPAAMMRGLHRLFGAYISTQGLVKRDDLKRQSDADREQTGIFNKIRAAHKEDFDKLAPKMIEIWAGLSPETKMRPSEKLLETVYKAAKSESLPDEAKVREKIIADMKAGHGEGGGEKPPPAGKKSDVDEIIEEYKKTKITLSEQPKGD